ncbi:MAG: hypothetical protein HKN80_12300 [Acidimicrobiia bacterium]|nr:hypothetical protein [Acidimicrobiia bacterium]
MRTSLFSIFLIAFAVTGPIPAAAQSPSDIAEIVAVEGYYVEVGAEPVNEARLVELAGLMQERGSNFIAVVLAEDPVGEVNAFAGAIVDRFSVGTTVVVLSPTMLGFDSTEYSAAQLTAAGRDSIDLFSTDVNDGFTLFADNLEPGIAAGSGVTGGSGGSGGFPFGLVLVVGAIVLFVFWIMRRQTKVEKQRKVEDISEAQSEIKHQLDEIANMILDESDAIRVSAHDEAGEHLQAASKTYADALDLYERTTTLAQLETISDALDRARWQLQAAVALRDGREVPPEPVKERATCFFDPAHPPATETAMLRTNAGEREVKVCPADAERLKRGQQPQPRQINVGGRPIPAPMAPKSYGGGGFGMMDVFEVILGGMSSSGGFGGVGRAKPHARRNRRYTRSREIPVTRRPSRRGLIRTKRGPRAGGGSIQRRGLRRR